MFKIFNECKPILPAKPEFYECDGIKYIQQMPVKAGERIVYLSSMPYNIPQTSVTYITDKKSKQLGSHTYKIFSDINYMAGDYIEVTRCEDKKHGFGEIMRLASLIEMKENNIKDVSIYSYPETVPFHFKYRFSPDLTCKDSIREILEDIMSNNSSVRGFKEKAAWLFKNLYKCNYIDEGPGFINDVNKFVRNYIMQNRLRWKSAIFQHGIPMNLNWNTVRSNADFYNKLFIKHAIDYKI